MEILTSQEGNVLTIAFNRPEKKNAITAAMYDALADALQAAERDDQIRAIVFTGTAHAFTAGNDLEDFMKHPPSGPDSPVFRFMHAISHASKPVVAAVTGVAVGIGTTMLLHCDLVYAAEHAKFALPFAQLGLCPELASSYLLPQLAGYQRAAEKLMLGEAFSAEEAREMGLVNQVMPADLLLPFVQAQAVKLAALPASSLRATKRLMKTGHDAAIDARMMEENKLFAAMLTSPEAKEAFTAFFEKRKTDFCKFS
ncbi:MAG: enoyl-CoA hydratase [Proteobacteria bacterium]|nr:enoyl-CoA hydratase [Pseudomonadota bacterium]